MSLIHWIMFQQAMGYGTVAAAKLMERFSDPADLFNSGLEQLARSGAVTASEHKKLAAASEEKAYKILEHCQNKRYKILTPDMEDYPQRLRNIYSFPAVLYYMGDIDRIDEILCISVVGTRKMTGYGARVARDISYELARAGVITVSGMSAGIDSVCHSATIKAGGRTIAVQGCGLDRIYPAANSQLRSMILESGGAVISEFPPDSPPDGYHFPIRNRIIAGLSMGTVVVEGSRHSGSLITAGHALTQGRDVFAVPGDVYAYMSQATNWLIREGATMVRNAEDILSEYEDRGFVREIVEDNSKNRFEKSINSVYNDSKEPARESSRRTSSAHTAEPPVLLSDIQRQVYGCLKKELTAADEICRICQLPLKEVMAVLTQLELFGLVKSAPGGMFGR